MRTTDLFLGVAKIARLIPVATVLVAPLACGASPPVQHADSERPSEPAGWRTLEPGLELGVFRAPRTAAIGDSLVQVVRVDPERFDLRLLNASAPGQGRSRTARDWAQREGLAAAINASMYQADHRRSVGLMQTPGHVNNANVTADRTVLAFDPLNAGSPRVTMIDRDCDDLDSLRARYGTLVQSIRMISCKGANVWSQQPRRWSTAAIGIDREGRVLLIHARSPYSVHDLIDNLQQLPLRLAVAMYVEGGPEAQLYVRAGGEEHEFVGSFETGFNENDGNDHAWPVPNVVGVVRRSADGGRTTPARPDAPGAASPVSAAARRSDSVADRVRTDLSRGVDVVVASYVGLWYENQSDPAHNLYWGNLYGHSALFSRPAEIRARLPFFTVTDYATTPERSFPEDPVAAKVFEARVPGATGKLEIVTLAYADMARAVRDMATHLKTGAVPRSLAGDAVLGPLLARSYVIGYWGHNIYYGGADIDDLESVARTTDDLPRGVFVVGCQSARWFPQKFLDGSIEPLLFTTTNMAPEAYIAVSLYDGLARGLEREEIRRNVARAYAVYQKLAAPPVSLFLNDRASIEARRQPIPGDRAAALPARNEPPAQLRSPRTSVPRPRPDDDGTCFPDEPVTPGLLRWQEPLPGFSTTSLDVIFRGQLVDRIQLVRVDPERYVIEVHNDPNLRTIERWRSSLDALAVVNGSYYKSEPYGEPMTPTQSRGKRLDRAAGYRSTHGALFAEPADASKPHAKVVGFPSAVSADDRIREEKHGTAVFSYPLLLDERGRNHAVDSLQKRATRTFVAEDRRGRILFGNTQGGFFSLRRLGDFLRSVRDLDLRTALNMDGGPPACMAVRAGTFEYVSYGQWESGPSEGREVFAWTDRNTGKWKIPIVISVRPRP